MWSQFIVQHKVDREKARCQSVNKQQITRKKPSSEIKESTYESMNNQTDKKMSSSISWFTVLQNSEISDKIVNRNRNSVQKLNTKDCQSQLKATAKQIQQLTVILQRLIPEDDRHTILSHTQLVEVFPDTLITYKIPALSQLSPCKINFKYLNSIGASDLRVFISCEDPNPTAKKCEQSQLGPKTITVLHSGKGPSFLQSYIYVSFYSEDGVSVIVTPKFKTEQAKKQP